MMIAVASTLKQNRWKRSHLISSSFAVSPFTRDRLWAEPFAIFDDIDAEAVVGGLAFRQAGDVRVDRAATPVGIGGSFRAGHGRRERDPSHLRALHQPPPQPSDPSRRVSVAPHFLVHGSQLLVACSERHFVAFHCKSIPVLETVLTLMTFSLIACGLLLT